MTKVQSDISKIEQILQSENCEAGFELLRTKNDPALNEALSDLIQSTVRSKYFEEVSDQKEVDKGLEILNDLLPNLTSLDMSCCYMEKLDISTFTNLTSLDLSYCDCLENVDGMDNLENLTDLNLRNTSSLKNLDVDLLSSLDNVTGLRDLFGMVVDEYDLEFWWESLDEYLVNLHEGSFGPISDQLGQIIVLTISEEEFYDQNFSNCRPLINITPDSLNKLQSWLSKEQINNLDTSMFPSANQISVFLFSINGYDLIASFIKNKDDFSIDCDECLETLTFAETIQVDPDDEWVRCCPDCAKERNKKSTK